MHRLFLRLLNKHSSPPSIRIQIAPNHMMAVLKNQLDWDFLERILTKYRNRKIKNAAGKKPHLRIMLGAVVVRCLESCTLRGSAELIRYHAPARYLCNLETSNWNPDYRTVFDFETMLGPQGLSEINDHILLIARESGFADVRGLCSDTTAQEARIPYPNEVGLIGSFADSVRAAVRLLAKRSSSLALNVYSQAAMIKKYVRKHRLFCKSIVQKRIAEKHLLLLASGLRRLAETFIGKMNQTKRHLQGQALKAHARLKPLIEIFKNLEPQIAFYLKHHRPTKDKIISLFQPLLRAIVRGKAGKAVEFGLKWGINQIRGGYVALYYLREKASEPDYAVAGVRRHIELFGLAPKDFGYDRGGWSADHLQKIKQLGVRNIAVAPRGKAFWRVSKKIKDRMVRERAQVEGKIGTLKMYGFNKPLEREELGMARAAFRTVIKFNLKKLIRDVFAQKKI